MSDEVTETTDEGAQIDEVLDERSDVERERDEYLEALQRLQAEFENYRKRVARSSEEAATRASGDLVARLLPTLDAFDLAVAHFANATSDEAAALVQTRGLLFDSLSREGLERINDAHVDFDPQIHDAVAHVEGDEESAGAQQVDDVLRAGYRWRGSVLRPAMVRVKG